MEQINQTLKLNFIYLICDLNFQFRKNKKKFKNFDLLSMEGVALAQSRVSSKSAVQFGTDSSRQHFII